MVEIFQNVHLEALRTRLNHAIRPVYSAASDFLPAYVWQEGGVQMKDLQKNPPGLVLQWLAGICLLGGFFYFFPLPGDGGSKCLFGIL